MSDPQPTCYLCPVAMLPLKGKQGRKGEVRAGKKTSWPIYLGCNVVRFEDSFQYDSDCFAFQRQAGALLSVSECMPKCGSF